MSQKFKRQKVQKVDHGNNYQMLPKRVTTCPAWRHSSFRMRSVVIAMLNVFDGKNNGEIEFSIKAIGTAIGSKSHAYNAKAVAEAIEKGFLECTSDANRAHAKARTYRLTFASTFKSNGDDVEIEPATHEYENWRPMKKRKFGGGRTTTTDSEKATETTTTVKKCVGETTTCSTENRGIEPDRVVGETATLLYTMSPGPESVSDQSEKVSRSSHQSGQNPGDHFCQDLETLRAWANAAVELEGYGGNNKVASAAGLTAVQLTRFRNGKNLQSMKRGALQIACSRILPFDQFLARPKGRSHSDLASQMADTTKAERGTLASGQSGLVQRRDLG